MYNICYTDLPDIFTNSTSAYPSLVAKVRTGHSLQLTWKPDWRKGWGRNYLNIKTDKLNAWQNHIYNILKNKGM